MEVLAKQSELVCCVQAPLSLYEEQQKICNECLGQRLVHPAVCLHGWVQLTKSGRDQDSEIMLYKLQLYIKI